MFFPVSSADLWDWGGHVGISESDVYMIRDKLRDSKRGLQIFTLRVSRFQILSIPETKHPS